MFQNSGAVLTANQYFSTWWRYVRAKTWLVWSSFSFDLVTGAAMLAKNVCTDVWSVNVAERCESCVRQPSASD